MQRIFFLITAILCVSSIILYSDSSEAYAQTVRGSNYDLEFLEHRNGGSIYQWTSHTPRIFDGSEYQDYIFTETADELKVETGISSVILDKNSCEFRFYEDGIIINSDDVLFHDSIIPLRSLDNGQTWSPLTNIQSRACQASWDGTELLAQKVLPGTGRVDYAYIFTGNSWKTELRLANNNIASNGIFGFQQIVDLNSDTIHYGNQVRNIDQLDGMELNRDWIEQNDGRTIRMYNGFSYHFGEGFANIDSVQLVDMGNQRSRLTMMFTHEPDEIQAGETLVIDPTYSSTNPAVDGHVYDDGNNDVCDGDSLVHDTAAVNVRAGAYSTTIQPLDCIRGYFKYDTSSIPDGATILDADITLHNDAEGGASGTCNLRHMVADPATMSTADLWADIKNGTIYNTITCNDTIGDYSADFGSNGETDIKNGLVNDFFAFGLERDETQTTSDTFVSFDSEDEGSNQPQLVIEYEVGLPSAPENLTLDPISKTEIDLDWDDAPAIDNVTGYRVYRETPIGGGFSIAVNDTGSDTSAYSDSGLTTKTQYNYMVAAWNATGIGANSTAADAYTEGLPDGVQDLTGTPTSFSTIELSWSEPELYGDTVGYQINYTTPEGDPDIIIENNTGTSDTDYEIFGLDEVTVYSFRIGVWNEHGGNQTGNIFNATTTSEFVIGSIDIPTEDNTNVVDISFSRTDENSTATHVDVQFPNNFNITCNIAKEFARTNQTYTNLSSTAVDSEYNTTRFTLNGSATSDIYNFDCYDGNGANYTGGRYIVTQNDFPLLEQLDNFKNGTYGTMGQFGAIDGITLFVIILSMLAFSRQNETAGVIFNVMLLGALAFFGIIEPLTIVFGAIAVIMMFTITSTKKV